MTKRNDAPARERDQQTLPVQYREASIVPGTLDAEQRTFDIVWTAGAEVPRVDYWTGQRYIEVLEVSKKAIRLDRLQSGRAPVLDSHSRWSLASVMGVVEANSVKIADGAEGTARVRLSKREDIAPLVSDVRDGIIVNVSPGYIIHAYREEVRDGKTYRIATDWEPMEISFVPIGADSAAARRSAEDGGQHIVTYPCKVTRADPPADTVGAAARMRMRARAQG